MSGLAPAAGAIAAGACALAAASGLIHLPGWIQALLAAIAIGFPLHAVRQSREMRARHDQVAEHCLDLRLGLQRDPLTGLMNRTAFNDALDLLADNATDCGTIAVLFFDLDRFKDVNDTLGHKVGDHLLVEVAARGGGVLDEAIVFARLGGDEFAAIVPCPVSRRPDDFGRALVEAMNEPFMIDGHRVDVSASVGIAVGDAVLDDGHELLRRADVAMYEAKGSTRGGWRVFDDQLSGRQMRESSIRAELGRSIAEQLFQLHYQPIIDARTGAVGSTEALLRPQSPMLQGVAI